MKLRTLSSVLLLLTSAVCARGESIGDLPLRKVVLFNSGLGYFEHETEVDGRADLELDFDKSDINDLLKSLVVQDLDGGQISSVSLPSRWPADEQLKNLSVDLTSQPTLGELLHQLRGERVTLDSGNNVGTILGVEIKAQHIGQQVVQNEVLNLLADDGLHAIPLNSIGAIKLVNEKLDADLREALKVLVAGRRADKKTVQFRFVGDGKRMVRIGYIRETPIWKVSYRIVLQGGKPSLLQGWAILENTGRSDWNNVVLTLTSGRPVTFQMELYKPLLVKRQTLLPSVPPSIASRVYSPDLEELDMDRPQAPFVTSVVPIIGPSAGMGGMGGGMGGGGMGGFGGAGFGGGGAGSGRGGPGGDSEFAPSQGVVAQATTSEIGEQFQYQISAPVSLARQRSALIPIVDQEIKTNQLSIFTAGADDEHPMLAFRMTNTTELRLTGGPITVFQDGAYAGDAQIEYLRPDEKRLVSYAQDVDLKIRYALDDQRRHLRLAQLNLGVVQIQYDVERVHRYRIQSRSDSDRKMILEQSRDDGGWKLHKEEQPQETTDSHYRFEVAVPAGKTVEVNVKEQRTDEERYDLKVIDAKKLEELASRRDFSETVRSTIKNVRELRNGIAGLEAKLKLQQQLLSDIAKEQSRIRSNMSSLDRDSDLYRRYVTKLTGQEDKFDAARDTIVRTRTELSKMRLELSRFFPSSDKVDKEDADDNPFGDDDDSTADPFGI